MSLTKFRHPYEPVERPQLEPEVKQAILASWASEAPLVASRANFWRPSGKSRGVSFDDIMSGMRTHDGSGV